MKKAVIFEILIIFSLLIIIFIIEAAADNGTVFKFYRYDPEGGWIGQYKEFYNGDWSAVITKKGFDYYIETEYGSAHLQHAGKDGTNLEFLNASENTGGKAPKKYSGKLSREDVEKLKRVCGYIVANYESGDKAIQHDGDFYYIYINGVYYQGCNAEKNKKSEIYRFLDEDKRFRDDLIPIIGKYALKAQKEEIK